jgi:hypothetical protein
LNIVDESPFTGFLFDEEVTTPVRSLREFEHSVCEFILDVLCRRFLHRFRSRILAGCCQGS